MAESDLSTPVAQRVFISYSSADREFTRDLASKLQNEGIDVWFADWELKLGDSIVEKVNEALAASDYLIFVVSKSALRSPWVKEEIAAATSETIKRGAFVLPVLVERCDLPPLLSHRKYVNFKHDPETALHDLLVRLGRRKGSHEEWTSHMTAQFAGTLLAEHMSQTFAKFESLDKGHVSALRTQLQMIGSKLYHLPEEVVPYYVDECFSQKKWLQREEIPSALARAIEYKKPFDEAAMAAFVKWLVDTMVKLGGARGLSDLKGLLGAEEFRKV